MNQIAGVTDARNGPLDAEAAGNQGPDHIGFVTVTVYVPAGGSAKNFPCAFVTRVITKRFVLESNKRTTAKSSGT